MEEILKNLKFDANGLIPVIIQDDKTSKVLTLCYMNKEALLKTLSDGFVYVFRRSQGRLMLKGETSGHTQKVKAVFIDCEGKSMLIKVEQKVAACHAGYFTCYYRGLSKSGDIEITDKKVFDPERTYK